MLKGLVPEANCSRAQAKARDEDSSVSTAIKYRLQLLSLTGHHEGPFEVCKHDPRPSDSRTFQTGAGASDAAEYPYLRKRGHLATVIRNSAEPGA